MRSLQIRRRRSANLFLPSLRSGTTPTGTVLRYRHGIGFKHILWPMLKRSVLEPALQTALVCLFCLLGISTYKFVAAECWPSFKKKGARALQILQAFEEKEMCAAQGETIAQRQAKFNKICQMTLKLVRRSLYCIRFIVDIAFMQVQEGRWHNFETFTITVGTCVNEDQALGQIHCSPGLEGVRSVVFSVMSIV